MTVNYKEYSNAKHTFFRRHKSDFRTQTSSLDEYDRYHKEYIFSDGAIWYEAMGPVWEKETVEVRRCPVEVEVKLFRVEFWNTDDANSNCYYEQY